MIEPPTTRDGRNLDPAIADQHGEGATIEVGTPGAAWPGRMTVEPAIAPSETYYDLPVVKAAPWKWYVPAYFFVGGVAGSAATLAAAAELAGDDRLAHRLHWISTVGEAAGAATLIADLGKPLRFLYMMRVFRPTSPMNMGTWILSTASASGGLALLRQLRGRRGLGVASVVAAVSGSLLTTYTGVLVGNTAIPLWRATRRALPLWFAATSAASLASVLELTGGAPRAYSIAAKAADLVLAHGVERAAAGVDRPLREGRSGTRWRTARWLRIASLGATLVGRPKLAGVLGTAAAILGRLAIVDAGRASADDPRATFEPQRAPAHAER